jgi:hypothetical protein
VSEYFTMEVEPTGDPNTYELITNQVLTDHDEEVYESPDEGEEGSPIAQLLFGAVEGILELTIVGDTLTITRDPDVPWEYIVSEVRDALRDFFL